MAEGQVDGEWVQVQKRTFTAWCNQYLNERLMKIADLTTDLADGIKLINLMEVISGKPIKGYNTKPKIKVQLVENCGKALTFIKRENIKLVGIGPEDIYDGKEKLILGLIWTLILRYQIEKGNFGGVSPKQALLEWVNGLVNPYKIKIGNFTSDWQDGKAISALTDSLSPGILPLDTLSGNPLKDTTKAIEISNEKLKVPKLMTPDDLVNNPEELSLITYLSYFRDVKPPAPKASASNAQFTVAHGSGLEPQQRLKSDGSSFTVSVKDEGGNLVVDNKEEITVEVKGPSGNTISANVHNNNNGTYSVTWIPKEPGWYTISVFLSKQPIKDSPWKVRFLKGFENFKASASGAGLKSAAIGTASSFIVTISDASGKTANVNDDQPFELSITTADQKAVAYHVKNNKDGTYVVSYTAESKGTLSIALEFNGKHVEGSPFKVDVEAVTRNIKFQLGGAGLKGGEPGKEVSFKLGVTEDEKAKDIEVKTIHVTIKSPSGSVISPKIEHLSTGQYSISYLPPVSGTYKISISADGNDILKERPVTFVSYKVALSGNGLKHAFVGADALFKVEVHNDKDNALVAIPAEDLAVNIGGPSAVTAAVAQVSDGIFEVKYHPTAVGEYSINIEVAGKQVAKDIKVAVIHGADPTKTVVEGPGVGTPHAGTEAVFTIKAFSADGKPRTSGGEAFTVFVKNPAGGALKTNVVDNNNGTYTVTYTPQQAGAHEVSVLLNSASVFSKSVNVKPAPSYKFTFSGQGLQKGVVGDAGLFTVTVKDNDQPAKDLETSDIIVAIEGAGNPTAEVKKDSDGVFTVSYVPKAAGSLKLNLSVSSMKVLNAHEVKIEGEPTYHCSFRGAGLKGGVVGFDTDAVFFIDVKDGKGHLLGSAKGENFEVSLSGPEKLKGHISKVSDGVFEAKYRPTKTGHYDLDVLLKGKSLLQSPLRVHFTEAADFSKSVAEGAALRRTVTGQSSTFQILAKDKDGNSKTSGGDPFVVHIKGPSGEEVANQIQDNNNGTYYAQFHPKEKGNYEISVTIGGKHIVGSPYTSNSGDAPPEYKFTLGGDGLRGAVTGSPATVVLGAADTSGAPGNLGEGDFELTLTPKAGGDAIKGTHAKSTEPGKFPVQYSAKTPGEYNLQLAVYGRPIFNQEIKVTEGADPTHSEVKGLQTRSPVNKESGFLVIAKDSAGKPKASGGDIFSVKAHPKNNEGEPYEVKVHDNHNGEHVVKYTPTKTGANVIDITLGGKPIKDSPFTVYSLPAETIGVTIAGLSKKTAVNVPLKLHLAIKNDKTNEPIEVDDDSVSVTAKGPGGKAIETKVSPTGTGEFEAEYTIGEGDHELDITLFGEKVFGPFSFSGVHAPKVSEEGLLGKGRKGGVLGGPVSFEIVLRDPEGKPIIAEPSDFDVSATGPQNENIKGTVKPKGDGVYVIEFVPKNPGDHVVVIYLYGTPITGHPISTTVAPTLKPAKVETPTEIVLGSPISFDVALNAADGSPLDVSEDALTLDIDGPGGKKYEGTIKAKGNGVFTITFHPDAPGEYVLSVLLYGYPIIKGLSTSVAAGADPEKSVVEHLRNVKVNTKGNFKVVVKDKDGKNTTGKDDVKVKLSDKHGEVEASVHDNNDGEYIVQYTPKHTGKLSVDVEVGGTPIKGSPFHAHVLPDADVTFELYGTGFKSGIAKKPSTFGIKVKDQASGKPIAIDGEAISVSASGPDGDVPVHVTPKEEGVFETSYTPEKAGDYKVTLFLFGNPISDPFEVKVSNLPSLKPIAFTGSSKSAKAGAPNELSLSLIGEDGVPIEITLSDFHAAVTEPDGTTVGCHIDQKEPGHFTIGFEPKKPGKHLLNVSIFGSPIIKDHPIIVTFPADPAHCTLEGVGPAKVNKEKSVKLVAKDKDGHKLEGGGDKFHFKVTGEEGEDIPVKVHDNDDGEYIASFTPTHIGKAKLEIFLGEHPLGSPVKINVIPEISLTASISGDGLREANILKPAHFNLAVKDDKDNFVSLPASAWDITVSGPEEVHAKVTAKEPGHFEVEYAPKKVGEYQIDLKLFGNPVVGEVVKTHVSAFPKLKPLTLKGVAGGVLGEPVKFSLSLIGVDDTPLEVDAEHLVVDVAGPEGAHKAKVTALGHGVYEFEYTPKSAGEHILTLHLYGTALGSGIKTEVGHGTDPSKVKVVGFTKFHVGKENNFKIEAHDKDGHKRNSGGDKFEVTVSHKDGSDFAVTVHDNNNGEYLAAFTPSKTGKVVGKVSVDGTPIEGSPFHGFVIPGFSLKAALGGNGLSTSKVNKPAAISVALTDDEDKEVEVDEDALELIVTEEDGTPIETDKKFDGKNLFNLSYVPKKVGGKKIDILLYGQSLFGGPKDVSTAELPAFKAPSLDSSTGRGAFLGGEIAFDVTLIGEDGTPIEADAEDFEVNIEGPESLKGKVTPKGNGVYTISFVPTVPGVYSITILLLGRLVLETKSAVTPVVAAAPHLGSAVKDSDAGEPVSFIFEILDASGKRIDVDADFIEVVITGPEGEKVPGKVHKNADGTYTLEFVAHHPGKYTADALLFGKSVLHSPFTSTVIAGPELKNTQVIFPADLYDTDKATATIVSKDKDGKPLTAGGAGFEAVVKGPDGASLSAEVKDNEDGTYTVSWDPTEPGAHEVVVSRKGQPVTDEPFTVDVKEGADAEYSGIERVAIVHCAVTVKAYTRKGVRKTTPGDKAVINVVGPEGPVECQIIDNNDGTYTVKYDAVPGDYHISATLNGKPVKGSPLVHKVLF